MTPLERTIVDAISRVKREGLEPTSIYLRPEEIEELGGAGEIGGLPVKNITGKGRPRIYTRHGLARAIPPVSSAPAPPKLSPGEEQILVSLLQGWPIGADLKLERRLHRARLVERKTLRRTFKGRTHDIGEPRLTGRGEEAARVVWDRMSRDERAELRAAALRSGLDFPATTPAERGPHG
jgi:hypothetical protein